MAADFDRAFEPYASAWREAVARAAHDPDRLLSFYRFATRPGRMRLDAGAKRGRHALIWGEALGLGGLDAVRASVREAQHIGHPLHVIVSGGDFGHEDTLDEIPAIKMTDALRHALPDLEGDRVSVEGFSKNTGHQARILAGWFQAAGTTDVAVVEPLYHLPRFLLTLGFACKELGIRPRFYPLPWGTWDTRHRTKSILRNDGSPRPDDGLTFAEMAFSPQLPPLVNEDPESGNTSELRKILNGWDRHHPYVCHSLTPDEAVDFFDLDAG